jgi:hypothetical protein
MAACPDTITILPNPASMYAVMANASMVMSNMTVIPENGFVYNQHYGNNWRIEADGGGFTATFSVAQAGPYRLRVRHATSFSQSCPNQGYAPVTIQLNGTNVVSQYDVAAHHANSYWYENDYWLVQAAAGLNTLEWMADDLCTHYWIQRVELMPVDPPRINSIQRTSGGQVQLFISAPAGTTNAIEVSTNLTTWSGVTNLVSGTTTLTWQDEAPPPGNCRFYRVLTLGW